MPLPTLVKNGEIDIDILRQEYLKAVDDDKSVDYLLAALAKQKPANALVIAYQACLETLKAKMLWNPLEKLAIVKQSQQTFAKAISISPHQLEIRFLRYSIQLALPAYLYLSNEMGEDKKLILKLMQEVEAQHIGKENLHRILDFMLQKGQCSATEKEIIKQAYIC